MPESDTTSQNYNDIAWYAMSAARKIPQVLAMLRRMKIYCWAPFHENPAADNCLMPLVLFRATERQVYALRADKFFPGYIYAKLGAEVWTPCKIDMMQVRRFKTIRDMDNGQYRYFADTKRIQEKGKPVKVVGGMFKGMEGYICRVKGSTSLYVNIPGICAVSIAYIPKAYLEGFDELKEKQQQDSAAAILKEQQILQLSDLYNQLPFAGQSPDEYQATTPLTHQDKHHFLERLTDLHRLCQSSSLSPQDLYLTLNPAEWLEFLTGDICAES